jgi:antitoxin (DNA-binding transcriptional repressor) of toxin-antitoxin stability system
MSAMTSVYEAKAHFSRLIEDVLRTGKPVVICRNRKPVVDLTPHVVNEDPLQQDPALKGAVFHGDPCAPVAESDWPEDLR